MMPAQTFPVTIGDSVTLPSGTVIGILGVSNGQVGLMVTEAIQQAPVRPPKRRSNGRKAPSPYYTPGSWEYWQHYKRRSWATWFRKYKSIADYLLTTPDGMGGRVIAGGDLRPTYYRYRDGDKTYDSWSFRGVPRHGHEITKEECQAYYITPQPPAQLT